MKQKLAAVLIILAVVSGCASGPSKPRPAKPVLTQAMIEADQAKALPIVRRMIEIENTRDADMTAALRSEHGSLKQKMRTLRGERIFKGLNADHLTTGELLPLLEE